MHNRGWIALSACIVACSSAQPIRAGREDAPRAQEAPVVRVHRTSGEGVTLAVLPFRNNTGEAKYGDLGNTLAESAAIELKAAGGILIVERQRIDEILSELKLQKADAIDEETAVKVGRLLGAQLMVFGSFASLDDVVLLTARVVSVETGEILGAASERGNSFAELEGLTKTAVAEAVTDALGGHKWIGAGPQVDAPAVSEGDFPKARREAPYAIGVVIGVKDYRNRDVPQARYAINDAKLMQRYLIRTLGYQPENIIYLENPTKAELEAVFGNEKDPRGKVARYIGRRDPKDVDLFVYYSGHGAPSLKSRQAYFVPADANPDFLEATGYSRDQMLGNLEALGVRSSTVVLEACFSGRFDGGTLIRKASPLVIEVNEKKPSQRINLFTSSAGNQVSSWYPEKRLSLFTYYFAKAVKESVSQTPQLKAGALIRQIESGVSELAEKKYNRQQVPQYSGNFEQAMTGL